MNNLECPNSIIARKVEHEYGEPFWVVVKQYANDGESISATAEILGYVGHAALLRLVNKRGLRHWFPASYYSNGANSARSALADRRRGVPLRKCGATL